jgi:hypothetical protein
LQKLVFAEPQISEKIFNLALLVPTLIPSYGSSYVFEISLNLELILGNDTFWGGIIPLD